MALLTRRRPARRGATFDKARPASSRERAATRSAARERTVLPPLQAYFAQHLHVMIFALGRLYRAPFASLITASVIGIALALPAGLYVALQNMKSVSGSWDHAARMSLYLKGSVDDQHAEKLAATLRSRTDVAAVRTITRSAALEEFRRLSGFGDALDALDENPLPAVLVVQPIDTGTATAAVQKLLQELRRLPEVEIAQLDLEWLERLYAIMDIAHRGVLVIAALLALAVLLIVGNTVRLDIQNRREEIEITKLIGATDAFIRRPFLWGGIWYGLFGGVIATLVVAGMLELIHEPVQRLAALYESSFTLVAFGPRTVLFLLCTSATLGLMGSWLAVSRHLGRIEP